MQPRDEGHPRAAMLLLFSMFAFAAVFHVVTRQGELLPAHFDAQMVAFAGAVDTNVPAMIIGEVTQRSQTPIAPTIKVVQSTGVYRPPVATSEPVAIASLPLIAASAWPAAPAQAPVATMQVSPLQDAPDGGAVTRALVTTRSALRNALKKAF